jgi:hypothetical protein
MNKIKFGLRPKKEDVRDFRLGAFFNLPKLEELPEYFDLEGATVKQQYNDDKCSGCGVTTAKELADGIEFSENYQFAKTKQIEGEYTTWGADLRDALKSSTKFGSLPKGLSPFEDRDRDFYANPGNWSIQFDQQAEQYKSETFFDVKGQYDFFDDARASIWKFKDKRQAVIFGLEWAWNITDEYINTKGEGFGHCMTMTGWLNKDYAIVQNSAGIEAGKAGKHYIHRDIINYYMEKYGSYMLVDMPREKAEYMLKSHIREGDNWFVQLVKSFVNLFK